jgi:hypothetical protein
LQQLDGNIIGRADESHLTVAWRPVYDHSTIDQVLAGRVDVLDLVREVSEIATAAIGFRIPVVSELHLRGVISGSREEHQGEAALRDFLARQLPQAERITVEPQ